MHNRLRMVTAQFFAKHCFLDWRLGEAYFMSQLVDGDFYGQHGGWQWSIQLARYVRISVFLTRYDRPNASIHRVPLSVEWFPN